MSFSSSNSLAANRRPGALRLPTVSVLAALAGLSDRSGMIAIAWLAVVCGGPSIALLVWRVPEAAPEERAPPRAIDLRAGGGIDHVAEMKPARLEGQRAWRMPDPMENLERARPRQPDDRDASSPGGRNRRDDRVLDVHRDEPIIEASGTEWPLGRP